jgi:hypothetical protein
MTPKEKAKELVLKYEEYFNNIYTNYKAIKCALIAVDEIIKCNPTNPKKWDYVENYTIMVDAEINYWQEVKQEIEKL